LAVKALAWTAIDLLLNQQLVEKARRELERKLAAQSRVEWGAASS
jgi:DNA-binding CsgD family transcriptional regulator